MVSEVVDLDPEAQTLPEPPVTDAVFHALADATRRDILRRTTGGALSIAALARAYPMSHTAVQKHVRVLERAGLVTKARHGREQHVRADAAGLRTARAALDHLEALWRDRAERMADVLADDR